MIFLSFSLLPARHSSMLCKRMVAGGRWGWGKKVCAGASQPNVNSHADWRDGEWGFLSIPANPTIPQPITKGGRSKKIYIRDIRGEREREKKREGRENAQLPNY